MKELTIREIELHKLLIPLKEPFVISLGPIYNAENVIVIIRTEEGLTGYGECSPFMSISGESIDTCFAIPKDVHQDFLIFLQVGEQG